MQHHRRVPYHNSTQGYYPSRRGSDQPQLIDPSMFEDDPFDPRMTPMSRSSDQRRRRSRSTYDTRYMEPDHREVQLYNHHRSHLRRDEFDGNRDHRRLPREDLELIEYHSRMSRPQARDRVVSSEITNAIPRWKRSDPDHTLNEIRSDLHPSPWRSIYCWAIEWFRSAFIL